MGLPQTICQRGFAPRVLRGGKESTVLAEGLKFGDIFKSYTRGSLLDS